MKAAYNRWKKNTTISFISGDFKKLLDYLKSHENIDRIGCINLHMSDAVVYFARKKVLWGTHHYLFNQKVYRFFPVMRCKAEDIAEEFALKYWCINTDYVNPDIFPDWATNMLVLLIINENTIKQMVNILSGIIFFFCLFYVC